MSTDELIAKVLIVSKEYISIVSNKNFHFLHKYKKGTSFLRMYK